MNNATTTNNDIVLTNNDIIANNSTINSKRHFRNLCILLTGLIPGVGSSLSFILDKYIPDYIENKRANFLLELENELSKLVNEGFEINSNSTPFITNFIKCIQIVDREFDKEKLIALQNILLNTSILKGNQVDFDEQSLFIRLVDMFTPDQIRILKAIACDNELFLNIDTDIFNVLIAYFPHVDKNYIVVCTQELVSWNLIASKGGVNSYRQKQLGYDEYEDRIHYLTDFGKRFVLFITKPLPE